jgi:hypothetical protein
MDSESESTQKEKSVVIGQKFTNDPRKGDVAEHFICTLASLKGAEVFKNINCTGKFDIILLIENQFIPIDVKLAAQYTLPSGNTTWKFSAIGNQCHEDAYAVYVCPIDPSDMRTWQVRWAYMKGQGMAKNPKFNCPEGLETFWD